MSRPAGDLDKIADAVQEVRRTSAAIARIGPALADALRDGVAEMAAAFARFADAARCRAEAPPGVRADNPHVTNWRCVMPAAHRDQRTHVAGSRDAYVHWDVR